MRTAPIRKEQPRLNRKYTHIHIVKIRSYTFAGTDSMPAISAFSGFFTLHKRTAVYCIEYAIQTVFQYFTENELLTLLNMIIAMAYGNDGTVAVL